MSKKNKRNRNTYVQADEVITHGPLQIARFGKNILWRSDWLEGEFEKFQIKLANNFDEITKEINSEIQTISSIVSRNPAAEILLRAWWEFAAKSLKVEVEADVGTDEAHSMRMLDYVQSIIASTEPQKAVAEKVNEDDWQALHASVKTLFSLINFSYPASLSAKKKLDGNELDEYAELFLTKTRMHWCNVRGKRFYYHDIQAMKDILAPHTEHIEALYGINAQQLLDAFSKIAHSLTYGLGDAMSDLESFRHKTLEAMDKLAEDDDLNFETPEQLMAEIQKNDGIREEEIEVFDRAFGFYNFDLQKITDLPVPFLEDFSWSIGEDREFQSEGPQKGWPLRVWPTFKRPFIKLNDRYLCFDLHSLFDHFYRQLEKKAFNSSEKLKQSWIAVRKDTTEELPIKYLKNLLPEAIDLGEVYYRWKTGQSGKKNWCETDRVFIYDGTLFVIEVKAGSFTWTSPDQDFDAYIASIRNLIEKPSQQADRFLNYLDSEDEVSVFDSSHEEIAKLRKSEFTRIIKCAITLDPFTEIAAQNEHLKKLEIGLDTAPVLSISIDDLRVYSDIFSNSLEFIHYLQQRLRALTSEKLQLDDELDHLGLYLEHNNYAQYAEEFSDDDKASLFFHGYRSKIDRYFSEKIHDENSPTPLRQSMPHRLTETIEALEKSNLAERSTAACYILDIDGEWRENTFGQIDNELKFAKANGRTRALSTHGEVCLTIFPWSIPYAPRNPKVAREHTLALIILHNEMERWLLEPVYSNVNEIISISFERLKCSDIDPSELPNLQQLALNLKKKRLSARRKISQKIGRNEPCPCCSGKKYKKCCLLNGD